MVGCIWQCKDTNFKANHNSISPLKSKNLVVFGNAKILILKLITTYRICHEGYRRCIWQCKDTNFKANHNCFGCWCLQVRVVFGNAKILILKLITTRVAKHSGIVRCIWQCKDTNFKANHNEVSQVNTR